VRPEAAARRDLAECRVMLRHGSRTFHAASFLLPRPVRRSACALYAFCRMADDAVDLEADPGAALAALRLRLEQIYRGTPQDHPADRALGEVVRRHAIPQQVPAALLEGFEWDAQARQYRDLPALRAYAVRVAGTVGVMMALLMGVRRGDALARACELGVAMQLTNIARDVGEDARAGRLYLPLDWLAEHGIDAAVWLARPRFSPALGAVVERLLEEADRLYCGAAPGIALLPPACRPGINAARLLYREIGLEVRRRGLDSVTRRAVVTPRRKAQVLAGALASVPRRHAAAHTRAVLAEAVPLLRAVQRAPAPASPAHGWDGTLLPRFEARVAWVLDLFERLEQRQRLARSLPAGARPR